MKKNKLRKINFEEKKLSKKELEFQEKKHKARRRSIKEGIFATMKMSFGNHYISPFAVAIQMSSPMIAMMTSFSGLLGPLSQMFSSRLMEKYSRKRIVVRAVFFETLMWIPFIAIAILFSRGILSSLLPLILLMTFSIYVILSNIAGPAWFSWMGDIVDEEFRGRWFAKRNLILGFVSVVLAVSASYFLDFFKTREIAMYGFAILFALAFLGRLMSWKMFHKQYEPKIKLKKGYYISFTKFLLQAWKNNFGKFVIFRSALAFASSISGPFLAVYLLRHLDLNYKTYMIVIFAGTVFALFVLNLWGKIADRFGNYKVLCITSFFIPLVPILWILHPSPIYLIIVPSIIGGVAWAGFNLSATNFIYDNVQKSQRGIAVSYYNMLIGIGIFLGAGLGALLIKIIQIQIIKPIFVIFVIGAFARALATLIFIPKIKEIKHKQKIKSATALTNLIFKEAKPTLIEEAHQIMSIKDYLRE